MVIICFIKGIVNIYYFFIYCRLFGFNNLIGIFYCFGNNGNGEVKFLGIE